jgi:hypothetical protein
LGNSSKLYEGVLITLPIDANDNYKPFKEKVSNPVIYSSFLWDAVLAYAQVIKSFMAVSDNLPRPDQIVSALRFASFEGATGQIEFDSNQDRKGGEYGVYNYQDSPGQMVLVGNLKSGGEISIDSGKILFADGTNNVPDDLAVSDISFTSIGAIAVIAVASVAIVLIALVSPALLLSQYRQRNRLILRSSPLFLGIILIGLTLALASVYFWFGTPTAAHCHLRVWLAFVGCATAYSALLTKNYHLWYLFNEPSLRVHVLSTQRLLSILALVIAPLLLFLVLWSSIFPFQVMKQENTSFSLRYWVCKSTRDNVFAPITFAYMFMLVRILLQT